MFAPESGVVMIIKILSVTFFIVDLCSFVLTLFDVLVFIYGCWHVNLSYYVMFCVFCCVLFLSRIEIIGNVISAVCCQDVALHALQVIMGTSTSDSTQNSLHIFWEECIDFLPLIQPLMLIVYPLLQTYNFNKWIFINLHIYLWVVYTRICHCIDKSDTMAYKHAHHKFLGTNSINILWNLLRETQNLSDLKFSNSSSVVMKYKYIMRRLNGMWRSDRQPQREC